MVFMYFSFFDGDELHQQQRQSQVVDAVQHTQQHRLIHDAAAEHRHRTTFLIGSHGDLHAGERVGPALIQTTLKSDVIRSR